MLKASENVIVVKQPMPKGYDTKDMKSVPRVDVAQNLRKNESKRTTKK